MRQWVKFKFPHITYERLQQSVRKGDIRVNDLKSAPQTMLNSSDVISIWDKLTIDSEPQVTVEAKFWKDIRLIEQNDDFWVIDKPYGVPTQGGTNIKVSLVEILQNWMGSKPYIVHRLDRYTTGLFVVATNSYAARDLSYSLKQRAWKKTYIGKLDGVVTQKSGVLDYPVFGRDAKTKFSLVETTDKHSLVEFYPITGRRHQIRQHAQRFLYPLVGDEIYGDKSKERMLLRCIELSFEFRGKKFDFELDY